ncbi:MAG: hypothetical protein NT104_05125 [Bacteroidetes bacterium]|jgi:hypothetical protein|nr:hypothetical protein [Bacteroidota bacterium]
MLTKKIALLSGFMAIMMIAITGCYKTSTIVVNPGSSITETMSFKTDIIPLFTTSCAKAGCHVAGAKNPDLTEAGAYKALTDGSYIKANDPDNSILMLWMNGKKSPVMPMGAGPDEKINAKIYAWIKQGAKNN